MREFNVTGSCNKREHYMVDISNKLDKISILVEKGKYFTINRARQYGKTTTIKFLEEKIKEEYIVIRTTFEGLSDIVFENDKNFNNNFIDIIAEKLKDAQIDKLIIEKWKSKDNYDTIKLLGDKITSLCDETTKPIVLIIDEIDKSSNHKLFLDFLGMLRAKYLERENKQTFHSVILAGVHDIKTIRYSGSNQNSRNNNFDDNARKIDSPWNIATDFEVDMSFNPAEISTMLIEYEKDHNTGMDIMLISNEIYNYTSGYPFLVSRICQKIDEKLNRNWSIDGVQEAVKEILMEKNTLFDDMFKNFENNKDLYELMYDLLIGGIEKNYNIQNPLIDLAVTFGFIKNLNGKIRVSNNIFERLIYDYFISKDETNRHKKQITGVLAEDVIVDGNFNFELCIAKFAKHYYEMFNENDIEFIEKHGRLLFLSYLKPLINGRGFYHIESETRNLRRMDIVVDYGKEQFIIEIKLWHGEGEHQNAYEQLNRYLETKNSDVGYLLTFDFRKNKRRKCEWETYNGKRIFDVII